MIVELRGRLLSKDEDSCVIDVGGIGYGIEMSHRSLDRLGEIDQVVHVFTHLVVREDAWRLIGFATRSERQCFLDMLQVNGVGIKASLALLGHLGVEGLHAAVGSGQWKQLKEAPGIGAKLAQRIQLELSNKWQAPLIDSAPSVLESATPTPLDEVLAGLLSLGYTLEEASAACKQVPSDLVEPSRRLREALRLLDRTRGGLHHGG